MINNILQKNKGYTLIELILYIALTAIILSVITSLVFFFLEARIREQTISEVDEQGRQIMQEITQAIRNSGGINSPTIGNNSSTLSLEMPTPAINPTIFTLSSGVVSVDEGGGGIVPLNNDRVVVTNLNFRNLSRINTPGTVKIEFTIEYNAPSDRYEYNYSKTFYDSISIRY